MSSDGGYSMPTGGYYMPTGGYGLPKGGSHGYSMRSGGYGRYRGGSGSYRAGYGSFRGGYGNHYNGSFGGGYGMDYDAGYYGAYNAPMQVIQNPPPGYGYGGGTPATVPMRQGQVPAQSNAVAQPSPHGLPLSQDECAKLGLPPGTLDCGESTGPVSGHDTTARLAGNVTPGRASPYPTRASPYPTHQQPINPGAETELELQLALEREKTRQLELELSLAQQGITTAPSIGASRGASPYLIPQQRTITPAPAMTAYSPHLGPQHFAPSYQYPPPAQMGMVSPRFYQMSVTSSAPVPGGGASPYPRGGGGGGGGYSLSLSLSRQPF